MISPIVYASLKSANQFWKIKTIQPVTKRWYYGDFIQALEEKLDRTTHKCLMLYIYITQLIQQETYKVNRVHPTWKRHQPSSCAECYSYKVIKIQLMSLIVTPFYELSLAVLLTVAFQCWLKNDIRLIYFADAPSLLLKIQALFGYNYTMPNKILRKKSYHSMCSIELSGFLKIK